MIKLKVTDNKTQKVIEEGRFAEDSPEDIGFMAYDVQKILGDIICKQYETNKHVYITVFIGKV